MKTISIINIVEKEVAERAERAVAVMLICQFPIYMELTYKVSFIRFYKTP